LEPGPDSLPSNSGTGSNLETFRFDYLVIGSGIAGLWFAYKTSRHGSVLVITKKEDTESNTNYAQGGIAAAVAENDSPELHCEDTSKVGQGLSHPEIVQLVAEAGPSLVNELSGIGVRFNTYVDARGKSRFDLGREGGHCRRRIVHAQDFTGFEIERGLLECVRSQPNVTISEEHFAMDLMLDHNGYCRGAYVFNRGTGRIELVRAGFTMLATGGIGQAYLHTTNPLIATGDGIAMGYRAGARVANMEFVQFHPTSLYGHSLRERAFLISEAVRGEGAILRTRDGNTFMERYHPDASLAPRDTVARAIDSEMKKRNDTYVLLDVTHLNPERVRQRFPNIHETCLGFGIDITRQPIPVVPAAHYVCGGLSANSWGETSVPGLFVAGECACSGLHGANRLASNSLLEALVFADRAAQRVAVLKPPSGDFVPRSPASFESPDENIIKTAAEVREKLRRAMWDYAGIVRSDAGLAEAGKILVGLRKSAVKFGHRLSVSCQEASNLLTVARLVVACAQRRPESRGLHYSKDHPHQDDRFRKDTIISREELEASDTGSD